MESIRALLGGNIFDQLSPPKVWGLDAEGELNQTYQPSGHPGLWLAIGPFKISRFYSKHLVSLYLVPSAYLVNWWIMQGLRILAQEIGIA